MVVPLRRNRDYLLLWSGQVVSSLGSAVSGVAFPLLVLALTGSPAQAGLVGFAGTLPHLLVQVSTVLVMAGVMTAIAVAATASRAVRQAPDFRHAAAPGQPREEG